MYPVYSVNDVTSLYPSGTLSPRERAVIKKEIPSPRPHRGRGAEREGAVEAAMHNLGTRIARSFNKPRPSAKVLFIYSPRMAPADVIQRPSLVQEKLNFCRLR